MKTSVINNHPSFGIKYINKEILKPETLKNFENSALRKSIDKKYPEAKIAFSKFLEDDMSGFEPTHNFIAKFQLADNKFYRWALSSYNKDFPEKRFIDFVNTTTLEKIESKSVSELKPLSVLEIQKHSPIKEFFKNLFSKKSGT